MLRRNFCGSLVAAGAISRLARSQPQPQQQSPQADSRVVLERSNPGQPHKGKVLLALQAHSDDIPLSAAGTVAKLIEEGYTGYLGTAQELFPIGRSDGVVPLGEDCVARDSQFA